MKSIILAGFGGQGILFAGKQLAHAGMEADYEVSWLPSYGPEMRGGTCNCSVIISKELIGCPVINNPDILFCFNSPSFDKFEPKITKGGTLFCDSSFVTKKSERDDITAFYVPATKLADENDLKGGANVILLGKFLRETTVFDYKFFEEALVGSIPPSKAHLIENNKKALSIGYNFR